MEKPCRGKVTTRRNRQPVIDRNQYYVDDDDDDAGSQGARAWGQYHSAERVYLNFSRAE